MSAPELTEMCEPLRATVYRRVDDRSDHGLLAELTGMVAILYGFLAPLGD